MSHLPRKPVRFIEGNQELLDVQKSVSGDQNQHHIDFKVTEHAYEAHMAPSYRTPHDRENGNEMFRRYPNGTLDVEYAGMKVVEALHKARDGAPLTGVEQAALSCCFPSTFRFVDSSVATSVSLVTLRLSPEEHAQISRYVANHLLKEMEFMLSSHAR